MNVERLRRLILRFLKDWGQSGASELPEAREMAQHIGVDTRELVDQLDIMAYEEALRAYPRGERTTAYILPKGKYMLQEMGKALGQQEAASPSQDSTSEAIALLEQVCSTMEAKDFTLSHLVPCCRKYLRVLRMLRWDDSWISQELHGYPKDQIPTWRQISGDITWYSAESGEELRREIGEFGLLHSVTVLASTVDESFSFMAPSESVFETRDHEVTAYGIQHVKPRHISTVLHKISEELFHHATDALVRLRFGQVAESTFKAYQASVETALTRLGIQDYLDTAYRELLREDEVGCQQAAMACRNAIHKLAETLWQVPGKTHPHRKDEKGKPVETNTPLKRMRAFLWEKGIRKEDMLARMLDPLYSMASAGKTPVSQEHARSTVLLTYVFLGEMVRLTGIEPVTEVSEA